MATKPVPGLNPENPIRVQPVAEQFLYEILIDFSKPAYFQVRIRFQVNPQIQNPDPDIIYFNINFLKLLNK